MEWIAAIAALLVGIYFVVTRPLAKRLDAIARQLGPHAAPRADDPARAFRTLDD